MMSPTFARPQTRTRLSLTKTKSLRNIRIRELGPTRIVCVAHAHGPLECAALGGSWVNYRLGLHFVVLLFFNAPKEMSEQTRHATPNLLISIHILWLLISSLLHLAFFFHRPPPPARFFRTPRAFFPSQRFFSSLMPKCGLSLRENVLNARGPTWQNVDAQRP